MIWKNVGMRHGAGGRSMRNLVGELFVQAFPDPPGEGVGLSAMDDGAVFRVGDQWLVFTTDSHVVAPRFFPGGDVGRLSISGTVNDLAMMGATEPLGLTCALVLEDGFPREDLERIRDSMAIACKEAGTTIVTGDTKVMGKGEIDGMVINTSGVGMTRRFVTDRGLRPGDRLIVSGTIGDHGFAIMTARHNLELEGDLSSDVAPINQLVRAALLAGGEDIVAMKDPTRGGLASAVFEMATKGKVGVILEEGSIPVRPQVRAASEILGIDPLQVACEGRVVMGVRPHAAERVLAALHEHPQGRKAAVIGTCVEERPGSLILDTGFGRRMMAELDGELMPRIC